MAFEFFYSELDFIFHCRDGPILDLMCLQWSCSHLYWQYISTYTERQESLTLKLYPLHWLPKLSTGGQWLPDPGEGGGGEKRSLKSQVNISHAKIYFFSLQRKHNKGQCLQCSVSKQEQALPRICIRHQLEINTKLYYFLSAWGKVSLTNSDRGEVEGRIRKM